MSNTLFRAKGWVYLSLIRHDNDDHSVDGFFTWETATQYETIIFGSPSRVREQLERMLQVSGCNYVIFSFAWGTLTHEQSMRSLRLFVDEVLPAFPRSTVPVA